MTMKWPERGGDSLLLLRSYVVGDYSFRLCDPGSWAHWIEPERAVDVLPVRVCPIVEGHLVYEDTDSNIFCTFSSRSVQVGS